jgi:glycosyltransferase involved in cell wall biosynthesis
MAAAVSVIIVAWNVQATIVRAIDSALGQDFADREIIVVNDGSTDETPALLRRYGDLIGVINQERGGIAPARNAAIRASSGEFIAFLDGDDVWLPDKLSRTVPILRDDPACVMVYSDATLIDHNGDPCGSLVPSECAHAPAFKEMFTRYWPLLESMAVVRRSAYDAVGGFAEYPGLFRANGAGLFWMRLRELGCFHYLPEKLVLFQANPYPEYIDKNNESRKIFLRQVREQYGWMASRRLRRGIFRNIRRDHRRHLGHAGLIAMREGRYADARRLFIQVLRHDPSSVKNAMRLLRTFLPVRMANYLTGRSRVA